MEKLSDDSTINFQLFLIEMKIKNQNIGTIFKHFIIQLMHQYIIRRYNYEAYSESKYRFAVKNSTKLSYNILLLSDSTFFKIFFHVFAAIIEALIVAGHKFCVPSS